MITGQTGSGKSYMANALAISALRQFKTVKYCKASQLIDELNRAEALDTYREALAHLDNRLGEEATADSDVVPVSIKNEAIVERRSQAAGEEKFRVLGAYVNRKMKHMGREILDGNIAASPYKNGQKTACDYCPYHSVCGFDLKTDGYQFRRFDKLSPEEIWGKMEEKDKKTER